MSLTVFSHEKPISLQRCCICAFRKQLPETHRILKAKTIELVESLEPNRSLVCHDDRRYLCKGAWLHLNHYGH